MTSVEVFNHILVFQGKAGNGWNITFNPSEVTAVEGLCAHISCTFTYPDQEKPIEKVIWQMCDENIFKNKSTMEKNETEQFKIIELDLSKNNCSIIMRDIKEGGNLCAFLIKGKKIFNHTVKIIIQGNPCLLVEFKRPCICSAVKIYVFHLKD